MKWFNTQSYIIKYLICMSLFLTLLFLLRLIVVNKEILNLNDLNNNVTKSNINIENEKYLIDVNYPKFKNKNINKSVTDWVYNYVKIFKEEANKKENNKLNIDYSLYYINGYVNIFFEIDNSLNQKDINKNILINLKEKTKSNITELYNEEILKEKIKKVTEKYPSYVSSIILEKNIDDFNYLITNDGYIIYFTNLNYEKDISYIPNIEVNLNKSSINNAIDTQKNMVALTFDDGPSEYSLEILKCLELNDAKATFFEIGINMKKNKEITKRLFDSGMEIGNHSYSHKYLTRLSLSESLEEINSVSILFNEITSSNISLLRVPYGSVNSNIRKNSPFPIISWNIDTKDWLHRDANISAPLVLDYVKDGDIILMHDVHYSTIELVKIIIPELKARGFELVTISELAKYKNYKLEPGVLVKEIK